MVLATTHRFVSARGGTPRAGQFLKTSLSFAVPLTGHTETLVGVRAYGNLSETRGTTRFPTQTKRDLGNA